MKKQIFLSILLNITFLSETRLLTLAQVEQLKSKKELKIKSEKLSFEETFWWQLFPTTGLLLEAPFWPLTYPYLPHAFSLWQMAPSLGSNCTVVVIDTGAAAFSFTQDTTSYTKHPNLTLANNCLSTSYNMIPLNNRPVNLYKNLCDLINHYSKKSIGLDNTIVPLWICEYFTDKTTTHLDTYLKEHGKSDLFKKGTRAFTTEGLRAKKAILHGSCGLHCFNCVTIRQPYIQEKVPFHFIPIPEVPYNQASLYPYLDHGTHVASIIGAQTGDVGGISGLAPACKLFMIKGLQAGCNATDPIHILSALEVARGLSPDILNASFTYTHKNPHHSALQKNIAQKFSEIPYVCACIPNQQSDNQPVYPAQYDSIHFSVGSFSYKHDKDKKKNSIICSLCFESTTDSCPLYVAPGENILGCSYRPYSQETWYALHKGTSYATPIMSGFVALMLSEFKETFTKDELIYVCENSCIKLHNTCEWKEKTKYGVLDMRTALFTLHVIQSIKNEKQHSVDVKSLVSKIHTLLFEMADSYAKAHTITISFKTAFMDYFNAVQGKKPSELVQKKHFLHLQEAITFVRDTVLKQE